ncbi:TetR/AcrR family transcriptional regulator [Actinoplanes sp. NPDC051861]|uniref:TetR/AcrR family transcriptional regulator n=1 Tax=Actinoplanes sp. NPDC051861 TaxID=3155170 RepID=UPI003413F15B
MARPRQALLTRERIVEAASALIDAEGLDALSMRRLATELGVQGPSLYNHFATKAEIVDAVAEAVVAQVDITVFADSDWREALRLWAKSYHAVLAAHPNIVPVLATGPGRRPFGLAMAEAVYGALIEAGWSRARATHIGALMRYLITGSALGSFALGFEADPDVYDERYPHLHRAHELAAHRHAVDEGAFELGLDLLIAGLTDRYDQGVRR